ncbi:hypothetical protein D9M70_199630 [compost metagenome]
MRQGKALELIINLSKEGDDQLEWTFTAFRLNWPLRIEKPREIGLPQGGRSIKNMKLRHAISVFATTV